jgi:hypothetical protein
MTDMSRLAALLLSLLLPLQVVAGLVTSHHCLGHQDAAASTMTHAAGHLQVDHGNQDCQGHDCSGPAGGESAAAGGVCQDCVGCVSCSIAVNSSRIEPTPAPKISPQSFWPEMQNGVVPSVETRPPIAS